MTISSVWSSTRLCLIATRKLLDYQGEWYDILYSQKYWRELKLAVEPKIAIARILADGSPYMYVHT